MAAVCPAAPAGAAAPCFLNRLPHDLMLRVVQSRAAPGGPCVLESRDLAALLVAAQQLCAPAVLDAAAERTVQLLGRAAGFNAKLSPSQAVVRLALAQRVDGDVNAAGFATAAALTVRTTVVSKASGRVASYGDAAPAGQPRHRDSIKACSNRDKLSLVVCEPATVYVFGWFHGHFVWHERVYAAQPPSATKATAANALPAGVAAPPPAAVPVAAVAPPLPAAEEELSLEERVTVHLRRVRHYIAHRNAALQAQ